MGVTHHFAVTRPAWAIALGSRFDSIKLAIVETARIKAITSKLPTVGIFGLSQDDDKTKKLSIESDFSTR